MTGPERRKKILELIRTSTLPLPGNSIAEILGVSRQVIVQDIALLRSDGHDILATARGYILDEPQKFVRLFKVCHDESRTEEELNLIVDLGGYIYDVIVNHKVYGIVTAPMHIQNRRDVQKFLSSMRSSKSTPLLNVTSGYHFHHVSAEKVEFLDEIEVTLKEKGFLAEFLPYESNNL